MYELHKAASCGDAEQVTLLLSREFRGIVDINQRDRNGLTPLILAACAGDFGTVRLLLSRGASVSAGGGLTALHAAVQEGHLAVTTLLVKAGADLETQTASLGSTPLHLAAKYGFSEVMKVLIEAGANPNSRALHGMTPLHRAAVAGQVNAIKMLLRAKADPLMAGMGPDGIWLVPLDAASLGGHLEVVHELIKELGIKGCGGASGGVQALQAAAAQKQNVDIMGMLAGVGVVDRGIALQAAANNGCESSVKFLLQQWKRNSGDERAGYLETCDPSGRTPMLCSIGACRACSPRITRLLLDAGADTTTAVRLVDGKGIVFFDDLPLAFTNIKIREKIRGEEATEEQLHSLRATQRLLMRVEAVHAVSWLWASDDATSVTDATAKGRKNAEATPTPLISMLPIFRRRAGRPRVLLAALFRHSGKPR